MKTLREGWMVDGGLALFEPSNRAWRAARSRPLKGKPGELAASKKAWRAGRPRASRPPQRRPGELVAPGRAGRLKASLASWPASGEPAASRQAKRVGRPWAPPQGKPGEPARLRASRPPQGKPGEPAASRQAWRAGRLREPAALCSLKTVLNFGFGLRPWGSPPAVALANFFTELVESENETISYLAVCFKLLCVSASKTSLASSISLQFSVRFSFELFKSENSQRLGKRQRQMRV